MNTFDRFRVTVFNVTLDTCISQLQTRFNSVRTINERFGFIMPKELGRLSDDDLRQSSTQFRKLYKEDISEDIVGQFLCHFDHFTTEQQGRNCLLTRYNLLLRINSSPAFQMSLRLTCCSWRCCYCCQLWEKFLKIANYKKLHTLFLWTGKIVQPRTSQHTVKRCPIIERRCSHCWLRINKGSKKAMTSLV